MQCDCDRDRKAVDIPDDLRETTSRHPCYSSDAQYKYARMHLPVAPACNISCNYCNRRFDCANESRPGVTSGILTPETARDRFLRARKEIPDLSVAGIAGPGDALANWKEVGKTVALIKDEVPDSIFCLSTNGLLLPEYGPEIVRLGIRHVTVTVNCLNPSIGAQIYRHVFYGGTYHTGEAGAEILIRNQTGGIRYLAGSGVLVKVNIVMMNDINTSHILEIVKKVKRLGAYMTNIMPLIPAPGSAFEKHPQTSMKDIAAVRELCGEDILQMRHCRQCRADAIGLLGEDQAYRFREAGRDIRGVPTAAKKKFKVAVTSRYKRLVDLHYGHAEEFHIYEIDGAGASFVETRKAVKYCGMHECDGGDAVKSAAVKAVSDCDAVLTMRIGYDAQKRLSGQGLFVVESCESVEEGLADVYRRLAAKRAI
jgi:nitrogen fixation protein NifB